jgi:hypothetical protein
MMRSRACGDGPAPRVLLPWTAEFADEVAAEALHDLGKRPALRPGIHHEQRRRQHHHAKHGKPRHETDVDARSRI